MLSFINRKKSEDYLENPQLEKIRKETITVIKKKYTDTNSANNFILSQDVTPSLDGRKIRRNQNVIVIDKNRNSQYNIAKSNMLLGNTNFIFVDENKKIYSEIKEKLEEIGYDIKIFDLTDYKKGNQYNLFKYINTEDELHSIATAIIQNTTGYLNDNEEQEVDFLYSVLSYLFIVNGQNITLNKVYENIKDSDKSKDIIKSLIKRLDFIKENQFSAEDEFDLDNFDKGLKAIFVIPPQKRNNISCLGSIMYGQLLNMFCQRRDIANRNIEEDYNPTNTKHIRFFMDYAYLSSCNIFWVGEICKWIATLRIFRMSLFNLIGDINNIWKIKEYRNVIFSNCDWRLIHQKDLFMINNPKVFEWPEQNLPALENNKDDIYTLKLHGVKPFYIGKI